MIIERIRKYLSSGLLLAFMIKMLFVSPSISDFSIVFALAALMGIQFHSEQNIKYEELEDETKEKLKEMTHTINQQNEVIKKMALEMDSIRNSVSSLKLVPNVKKVL